MTDTLGDALPREMARVTKLIALYASLPDGVGQFAIAMMRADLDRAAKAMAEGDVAKMKHYYQELKGYAG